MVYGENEVLARVGGVDLGKLAFDEILSKFETYQNGVFFVETFPHVPNTSSPARHNTLPVTATSANLNVRYALVEKPSAHVRKRNEVGFVFLNRMVNLQDKFLRL